VITQSLPDEQHEVVDLDVGGRREVPDRLEDHEQRVVVAFELRPLLRLHRVLDGQRMQPQLLGEEGELLLRGLAQGNPHKGVTAGPGRVERVADVTFDALTGPVLINRTIDNHSRPLCGKRARCRTSVECGR